MDALIGQWPEANVYNSVSLDFNTYVSVEKATNDAWI